MIPKFGGKEDLLSNKQRVHVVQNVGPYFLPFTCPMKPPFKQLLTVPVQCSSVPMYATKFVNEVEKFQAVVVGRRYSVEC